MNRAVVVQARNSSMRYPKKMLVRLAGKPALEWVLRRCEKINVEHKILATSEGRDDNILVEMARDLGWSVVRGGLEDVLGRFAKAVREFGLDLLVRITGDCLLTDYRVVNDALMKFDDLKPDYLALTKVIDGFDVEIISGRAILLADSGARLPSEREHVGPYIRKTKKFKAIFFPYGEEDLSSIHLSLDHKEDADVLESILKRMGVKDFSYTDVARLIKDDPGILEKTRHIVPNQGYERSIEEDRRYIRGIKGRPLVLAKNIALFKKVLELIPNGSQTFSKSHLQFSVGASPLFVKEGRGCLLTDPDENSFIDYTMGLGACILGYVFEPVIKEVEKTLWKGSAYTLPHHLEYELADLLVQIIPSAQMVRFGKNGSDVTSAAIRLARAYTGRDYVACCGYHGWQDWYISTTTRNRGIPEAIKELTLTFKYNRIGSLEGLFDQYRDKIACVIMEPVSLAQPQDDFLHKVEEITHKNGALLIFDEVVTGFRFALGGAQEFFGVTPDITCLGKGMANGMPLSALVGRREMMRLFDEVFFSFTFGGEILSIVSGMATIRYIMENGVTGYIWGQGRRLKEGIEGLIKEKDLKDHLSIDGYPVRTVLNFKGDEKEGLKMKTLFQQECAKRGILFTGAHNISLPHDNEIIERTLSVYDEVMDILKYSLEYCMIDEMLEGRLLEPVFRKV